MSDDVDSVALEEGVEGHTTDLMTN